MLAEKNINISIFFNCHLQSNTESHITDPCTREMTKKNRQEGQLFSKYHKMSIKKI